MKRFLDLADLERDAVLDLLALAARLQQHPEPHALAGRILGMVFFNPSLRTLASFQAGMARLGGTSFVVTPGQGTWKLEHKLGAIMDGDRAEHVREGIPVLASYCAKPSLRNCDFSSLSFQCCCEASSSAYPHCQPCQPYLLALASWQPLLVGSNPRSNHQILLLYDYQDVASWLHGSSRTHRPLCCWRYCCR